MIIFDQFVAENSKDKKNNFQTPKNHLISQVLLVYHSLSNLQVLSHYTVKEL